MGSFFVSHKPSRDPVRSNALFGYALIAAVVFATYVTVELGNRLPRDAKGNKDFIIAAVPAFFFLIFVEIALLKLGAVKKSTGAQYSAADTWSSLAAGTVQQSWFIVAKRFLPIALFYDRIYDNYAVYRGFEGNSWLPYVLAFVISDFSYYWFHRAAHEWAVLWAGHSVHHSSEHYNLSTALRQSTLQGIVSPLWSLPWAFVMPPSIYILGAQWVTLYQFYVHTCVIRHLGPLEYVFVTPSHHRVHHDRRVHKNFAGVLIIWDRLFGTFHDETNHGVTKDKPSGDETCYFGIKETIGTWSEAVTQFMMWEPVLKKNPVVGPGWSTTTADRPLPVVASPDVLRLRVMESVGPLAKVYIYLQYGFSIFLFVIVAVSENQLTSEAMLITVGLLVASLVCQGLMFDGSMKVLALEILRCAVTAFVGHKMQNSLLVTFHCASLAACLMLNRRVMGNGACAPPKSKQQSHNE